MAGNHGEIVSNILLFSDLKTLTFLLFSYVFLQSVVRYHERHVRLASSAWKQEIDLPNITVYVFHRYFSVLLAIDRRK